MTTPLVVLCSNDLMFGSRISAVARDLGCLFQQASSWDQVQQAVPESGPVVVVVDLTLMQLTEQGITDCREKRPAAVSIIAFGPHVQAERLAAAQSAGCDHVLTRGQFDRSWPELLRGAIA